MSGVLSLLIINKRLQDDIDYYQISNFNSYVEQAQKFILSIYNNINKYIPQYILDNQYY